MTLSKRLFSLLSSVSLREEIVQTMANTRKEEGEGEAVAEETRFSFPPIVNY